MAKYLINEDTREIYFFIPIRIEELRLVLDSLNPKYDAYDVGSITPLPPQDEEVIIPMAPGGEA